MADPSPHSNDRDRQCSQEFSSVSKFVIGLLASASDSLELDRGASRRHIAHAVAVLTHVGRGSQSRSTPSQGGLAPGQKHRLAEHIDASLRDRVVVADLSKMTDLSTSHFARAFKYSFGMAPHAYILRRRVEQARRLMLETKLPLCQIALECGFSDQSHFSRVFQRLVGTSPNEWRRLFGAGVLEPPHAHPDANTKSAERSHAT
jgi:AraC-like DNA-binding protein